MLRINFNSLAVIERWVEHDMVPAQITAYRITDNRVDMTRLRCLYPQTALYNGSGSVNDAANSKCGHP